MSRHQQQIDYALKGKINLGWMSLRKTIIGWFRRYGSTNLFHKQLDFCFASDFLCITFQVKFSLCKWRRNICLVVMYFIEKLQSSVAIFCDLDPLIAIISITFEIYVDQCLVKLSYSWWNYLILAQTNTPNCLEAMERKVVIAKRKYWTIPRLFFWICNEIVTSIRLILLLIITTISFRLAYYCFLFMKCNF